jgi:hypothetical protein
LRRIPILFFAALLLFGACGDDGGSGGSGTAPLAEGEPAPEGIEGVVATDITDVDHVEGSIDYPSSPPTGGNHNQVWANCHLYDEPVPDENAVHSLEHGAVWIAFAEDLPDAEVQTLAGLASDHVLVAPYPGLDAPVVLTAWNRQLAVDAADDPRIPQFLQTYVEGPTAPEVEAPCTGGAG